MATKVASDQPRPEDAISQLRPARSATLVSAMRVSPIPIALAVLAAAPAASAQPAPDAKPGPDAKHDHPSLIDRPHTIAELEVGIISLPAAPISESNQGLSTPLGTVGSGDTTVQTGVHLLYRASGEWAFGAGALLSPTPSTGPTNGGASNLPRLHSRSYLFLGGEGRYYPLRSRWFEGFFGITSGALIIADRFYTNNAPEVPSILGLNEVTVRTEGFAVGAQIGGDYLINDSLVIGLALRGDWWLLPGEALFLTQTSPCDPIGDCRTLTGNVIAYEVGLTFGYRLPL
jgi:hypothetical protein